VFIPADLLLHGPGGYPDQYEDGTPEYGAPAGYDRPDEVEPTPADAMAFDDEHADHDHPADVAITLLPQRNPGTSGISDIPSAPIEPVREPARSVDHWAGLQAEWPDDSLPQREPEPAAPPRRHRPVEAAERQVPTDTSSFFAAKAPPDDALSTANEERAGDVAPAPPAAGGSIFEKMLSEWLIDDPAELAKSTDLDWQTVWDHGWSAAVAAEDAPVTQHTEHGLPMRQPGVRLVPGAAGNGVDDGFDDGHDNGHGHDRENGFEGGSHRGPEVDEERDSATDTGPMTIRRDPEAVRSSIGDHFGGVRAGRLHARDSARQDRGTDHE
jgi:hypothetical protein